MADEERRKPRLPDEVRARELVGDFWMAGREDTIEGLFDYEQKWCRC
jgi:hypothetical protein